MAYTRDEISAAFDRYREAAKHAGATGDWKPWVECFTPDLHYIEHHYGEFHGREAVLGWITSTMGAWAVREIGESPWDWYTFPSPGSRKRFWSWPITHPPSVSIVYQNRFSD